MSSALWITLGVVVGLVVLASLVWAMRSRGPAQFEPGKPDSDKHDPTAIEIATRTAVGERPAALSFGTSAESPVLTITNWGDASVPSNARQLNVESSYLAALTPILQTAPSVLTAVEFSSGNYMKVVIDGSLAAGKDGGFLPFVRDANGRVIEVARLHDPATLSTLISAAAVWQVATIIVAQKHLLTSPRS